MRREKGAERLTAYLVGLIALLFIATFLEGYDFFIVSLILDRLCKSFHITQKIALTGLSIMNIGALLGFFVVRLADRVGRKPIFVFSVMGYGVLSIITASAPTFVVYVTLQFFTKMFLVAEFNTAIIIISEEFPPRIRATAVGVLEMAGGIGGVAAALFSKFALPMWGWRVMYMVGGLPLALAPVIFFVMRETGHYAEVRKSAGSMKTSIFHIWTTPSRRRVTLVGALWFLAYLSYASILYHWVLFAKTERGWTESQIGLKMGVATVIGMLGYVASGAVMDAIGRRATGVLFFLCAAAGVVWAFSARDGMMLPSLVFGIFFVCSLIPICSTYNAELFPTELRAQASAWSNFLIGRPAQVAAPFIVANLIGPMGGVGASVRLLAVGSVIAAVLVLFFFPETKGIKMDNIH